MPGQEFTGAVSAVGSEVTAFAPGDAVAVGTVIDSCGHLAVRFATAPGADVAVFTTSPGKEGDALALGAGDVVVSAAAAAMAAQVGRFDVVRR